MLCPECLQKSDVVDSRTVSGGKTRRRRVCRNCKHRYTTLESLENSKPKGKPKPKPTPKPKKKLIPRKPKPVDFEQLTDEQLEAMIFDNPEAFDEDEL